MERAYPLTVEARGSASRIARKVLQARLEEWAQERGFKAHVANESHMLFTRGSSLLTSVAFGIRYVPTDVRVDVEGDALRWSFRASSSLQYLSEDDREEAYFEITQFLDHLERGCVSDPSHSIV